MTNVIILNKTNISDVEKELISCVLTYDYLCLSRTQKWCTELLNSLEGVNINVDMIRIDFSEVCFK